MAVILKVKRGEDRAADPCQSARCHLLRLFESKPGSHEEKKLAGIEFRDSWLPHH